MSQSGLYGFDWPAAAPGAPNSTTSAIPNLSSVVGSTSTISEINVSTAQSTAMSSTVSETVSVSPSSISAVESQRSTSVQDTMAPTITPSSKPNSTVVGPEIPTITRPAATGISSEPTPLVPITTATTMSPRDLASRSENATKNVTIAGGIIGGIFGFAILILLIKFCSRRQKAPDVEHVQRPNRPNSNEVLDEVQQRARRSRAKRAHESAKSDGMNPVDLAKAQGWVTPFGADSFQNTNNRNRPISEDSTNTMAPSEMAQAHAWNTPFGEDRFQPANTHGPQFPTAVVTRKPVAQARTLDQIRPASRHLHRHNSGRQGGAPSVSPMSTHDNWYASSNGRRHYGDVSPLDSPTLGRH